MKNRTETFKTELEPFEWLRGKYLLLILAVGVIISLIYLLNEGFNNLSGSLGNIFSGILNTAAIWLGCVFIVKFLWQKYPWQEQPVKHLVFEIILITAYTVLISAVIFLTQEHLFDSYDGQTIGMAIFTTLLITYLITAIHESVFFYRQWKFHFGKSSLLERDNMAARYDALRTQINPHFLFNSLNGLATLVEDNPKAQEYIGHLSGLMRSMLSSNERELSLLRDEVKVLQSYLALQQLRFGDNLKVKTDIPESSYHRALPPLSLQMLAENAIKHNVITREMPLSLHIVVDGNAILVKNNLQRKSGVVSTGKGLNNIAGRYAIFTTRKPEIKEENNWFSVSLPLLEAEL